jgi:CsoR family transcriptional regulator, copper-sensing transcriptional repressor
MLPSHSVSAQLHTDTTNACLTRSQRVDTDGGTASVEVALIPYGGIVGAMEEPTTYWYAAEKQALLGRLRRIEGQVRGVHRMVEQDTYCIDVLTQISAATKALQAVALGLLEGHLAHCVVEAGRAGDPTEKVKEATDAIARLVRS